MSKFKYLLIGIFLLAVTPVAFFSLMAHDNQSGKDIFTDVNTALLAAYAKILEGHTVSLHSSQGALISEEDIVARVMHTNALYQERTFDFLASIQGGFYGILNGVSKFFVGAPYLALSDIFTPWEKVGLADPFIRCDAFDHMTYVEMVFALTFMKSKMIHDPTGLYKLLFATLPRELLRYELSALMFAQPSSVLRYQPATFSVANRHRFVTQWVNHNSSFLDNATEYIGQDLPFTGKQLTKKELIWQQVCDHVALMPDHALAESIKQFYEQEISSLTTQTSLINYIPLAQVIEQYDQIVRVIRVPCLLMVVCDRPKLRHTIGSHRNADLLAFLMPQKDNLIVRYASARQDEKMVVEKDLRTLTEQYCEQKGGPEGKVLGYAIWRIRPLYVG